MRFLFIVQNYYPSVGGTQIFFQNLAEYLVEQYKDEVIVYTSESMFGPEKSVFNEILPKEETRNGVLIKRFPFFRWHLRPSKFILKMSRRVLKVNVEAIERRILGPWSPSMMKAISESDADVILAGTSGYYYMLYPLIRKKHKRPKPFVCQGAVHFKENQTVPVLSKSSLKAIKEAEFYIANTLYEKERLVSLGVAAHTIVVGGSSIAIQSFQTEKGALPQTESPIGNTDILVAFLGRIEPTKGIELLIKAFVIVQNSFERVSLILAGYVNNNYLHSLHLLVAKLPKNVSQRIHFLVNLPQDGKVGLYQNIDIFVLPSKNESFGMVFLEAWACKKPVIGANIGAVRSVISGGTDGLLFDPDNEEDLAEKILLLATNASLRERMGKSGFEKTRENFVWEVVAEKYRNILVKAKEKFHVQRGS